MGQTVLYDNLEDCFDTFEIPDWYDDAVSYLRGDKDHGLFGLYLYNLIESREEISTVVNIGTARGHSAVCAAKGLAAAERSGRVITVDVIDPDERRNWHRSGPASDPLRGSPTTMRDLVSRFHDPEHTDVSIDFRTGDSSSVLEDLETAPDLVFHDGLHTYSQVRDDIEQANSLGAGWPIHVFDDCYLYADRWDFRPFTGDFWYGLDEVSTLGGVIRKLRSFALTRKQFPGVTRAVRDTLGSELWPRVEVVQDVDHAPITGVFPD